MLSLVLLTDVRTVYTCWHADLCATLIFGDHVILLQTELGWLLLLQLHEDIQVLTKATLDISQSLKLQQVCQKT